MKRLTRFSIRHLIALTIIVALLMPVGIAHYPKVVALFTPKQPQPEPSVFDGPTVDILAPPIEDDDPVFPEGPYPGGKFYFPDTFGQN